MANWTHNTVTFGHRDRDQMHRLAVACLEGNLFREFVPMTDDNSWEACCKLWGVKSEAVISKVIVNKNPSMVEVHFDTANNVPYTFYDQMNHMGWNFTAWYWGGGDDGCGKIVADGREELGHAYVDDPLITVEYYTDVERAILLALELEYQ